MKSKNLFELGEQAEKAALAFVSRTAPWLGPLPTAYLVYDRVQRHLAWPPWVALAAAITLEFLGLATAVTTLRFGLYNQSKNKTEARAPTWIPFVLTVLYFVSAIFLTVVLDVVAVENIQVVNVAPVVFPILSLASVLLLAVRSANAGAFLSKAQRRAQRAAPVVSTAQAVVEQVPTTFRAECDLCSWAKSDYKTQEAADRGLRAHVGRSHSQAKKEITQEGDREWTKSLR